MLHPILYWFLIIIEIFFVISFLIYMISLIYSTMMGSPYVPIKRRKIKEILKQTGLKKNQKFIDIGCGDGRVVEEAVLSFNAQGFGIDINPVILLKAKLRAKIKKIKNIEYKKQNIFDTDFSDYNMIYLFLMPKFIEKLSNKLEKSLQNGSTIVSHGFKIESLSKYLKKKVYDISFPTYIYHL